MHILLLREITRDRDDTAARQEDERDKGVVFNLTINIVHSS